MTDIIELIKTSPDSIKWVGYFLAYLVAVVILVERIHALYSKSSSEKRARKTEDLSNLSELVGNDDTLKALSTESKHYEAFSKLTRLSASKERRDQLLKILAFGFLSPKDLRMVAPYLKATTDGKFSAQIGLAEIFIIAFGTIGIFMIGVIMMTINFVSGEKEGLLRLVTLALGGAMIFMIAYFTRGDMIALRMILITSKKLEDHGLLEGQSGLKAQLAAAWKTGRKPLFVLIGVLTLIFLLAWIWARSLRG